MRARTRGDTVRVSELWSKDLMAHSVNWLPSSNDPVYFLEVMSAPGKVMAVACLDVNGAEGLGRELLRWVKSQREGQS